VLSIKAKQVAGVTTLVVGVVAVLSALHLATLARLSMQETVSRAQLLASAIFQRARDVAVSGAGDPYDALRRDGGVRSILESSIGYSPNVTYAAIVNPEGIAVAHSFPSLEGAPLPAQEDLKPLVDAGALKQLRAVYTDRTFEIREPMLSGDRQFGTIRIGVSTLLVRNELQEALNRAAQTVLAALVISMLVSVLLAQWMLRPIHVIQSGLSRLGRGELDVTLDLPGQEFRDLGSSFEAVSAQITAIGRAGSTPAARSEVATDFESVMENLEDAVALFSPGGELIFSNSAMRAMLNSFVTAGRAPSLANLQVDHPVRQLVDRTLAGRKSQGPVQFAWPTEEGEGAERLLMCHAIADTREKFLGAMLVARNLAYLSQVHSTLHYSRKLAALGRLMAGVAHEVKNPLNAMTIHLELLNQKLARVNEPVTVPDLPGDAAPARSLDISKHVQVISEEIRRLDEVVIGFLKFARPEELKLQPLQLASVISDVATTVGPEALRRGVTVKTECPPTLVEINADPGMLQQALLNLAINGCQAMPDGGTLRMICRNAARGRVEVIVEDTGIGIPPENLARIFDLYFTTKDTGTGIGLSMVYRIVQLHDGEVEVESTPGHGTRFRLTFPQA
jgi:signal transduction histidine kinase